MMHKSDQEKAQMRLFFLSIKLQKQYHCIY